MGVVARVVGQQAGRSRTFNAFMGAVRATGRSFANVAHQLWLELTGVIFLIMALEFGGASVKEYGKYHAGQSGAARVAVPVCCTLAFAWFGLSSFWRVRKKRQRGVAIIASEIRLAERKIRVGPGRLKARGFLQFTQARLIFRRNAMVTEAYGKALQAYDREAKASRSANRTSSGCGRRFGRRRR